MNKPSQYTHMNRFTGPIVKEAILLIVHHAQSIGNVIGQGFQIERVLSHQYGRIHGRTATSFQQSLLVRCGRHQLHSRVASAMDFDRQRSMIAGRNAVILLAGDHRRCVIFLDIVTD